LLLVGFVCQFAVQGGSLDLFGPCEARWEGRRCREWLGWAGLDGAWARGSQPVGKSTRPSSTENPQTERNPTCRSDLVLLLYGTTSSSSSFSLACTHLLDYAQVQRVTIRCKKTDGKRNSGVDCPSGPRNIYDAPAPAQGADLDSMTTTAAGPCVNLGASSKTNVRRNHSAPPPLHPARWPEPAATVRRVRMLSHTLASVDVSRAKRHKKKKTCR
jgi:hypothetical protein